MNQYITGAMIRRLREERKMTQHQLAEKMGVAPQSVSKWENAVAMPDISSLPLLAEIFGVSIDDLFHLSAEQRFNRIENRMDAEEELPQDVFREFEDFLKGQLADGENNHCECDNCIKMRPADWYVKMLNELDEKLTAAGLATKIVFLIYVDLLWEPRTERIENPDRFILMFAPITRNYGENYGDCLDCRDELPPYERNRLQMPRSLSQNIARLRRWQAIFDGDSFDFDYHLMWAHVGDIGYEKCARNLFCDMRDLEKIGLGGMVSCQVQRCFFPTAMPFVAMAGALWNKNADFDGLADDWYSAAYGEPGARVRDAMKTLSASCGLYEDAPVLWDPAKARRGLDALRAVCAEAPDIFSLKAYCEYLERLFALFDAMDGGEKEKVRAAAGTLFDWAWENEQALQPLFDAHNTVGVIRRMQGRRGF